jgi:hypothetical protein
MRVGGLAVFGTFLLSLGIGGCSSDDSSAAAGGGAASGSTSTGTSSTTGSGGGGAEGWQVALDGEDLDRAVLSVWGSSPTDVYAVGGPLGNSGFETLVVHYDGETFRELGPGGTETFWWVGGSAADDVWMVGEEGRIAHWDGSEFVEHESGVTATLWGVWAASPSDAWIVGGTPGGGTESPNDILLHWDGAAWTPVTLPGEPLGRSLFKVWGTSSEDLYLVGEAGTIWHKSGAEWALVTEVVEADPPLATGTLFTVSGCSATDVYAVGNFDVLHYDGASWSRADATLTGGVNGVSCDPSGVVTIVGSGGLKQRLVDGAWKDDFSSVPYSDLHATWSDGSGAFWAVGGAFIGLPKPETPREGIVARYAGGALPSALTP